MPVLVAPREVRGGKSVRPVSIGEPEESSVTSSASNSEFGMSSTVTLGLVDHVFLQFVQKYYAVILSKSWTTINQRTQDAATSAHPLKATLRNASARSQ
jgi:hypothetical protein